MRSLHRLSSIGLLALGLLGLGLVSPAHAQNPNRPDQRKKRTPRKRATKKKTVKKQASPRRSTPRRRQSARKRNGPSPGPFAKGRSRLSLSGGTTNQFNTSYIVIGGGYGYFVANGLELGLDAAFYFGDDPSISVVSPNVRYIVWQAGAIKPYVGVFAQRQFLGEYRGVDLDDIDSVGARGGIVWSTGRSFLTLGLAYSQVVDCESHTQIELECERYLPEFGFGMSL